MVDASSSPADLVLVGYWSESERDPSWIHPSWIRGSALDGETKANLVRYLRSGVVAGEELGYSRCRIPNGPRDEEMGCAELSDGTWLWPEGLWVYVERFDVRLPDELIADAKALGFEVPANLRRAELEQRKVTSRFWMTWCERERARLGRVTTSSTATSDGLLARLRSLLRRRPRSA